MKKELGDLEAEVFVLAHTEELLSGQEQAMLERVRKVEKQQGISVSDGGRARRGGGEEERGEVVLSQAFRGGAGLAYSGRCSCRVGLRGPGIVALSNGSRGGRPELVPRGLTECCAARARGRVGRRTGLPRHARAADALPNGGWMDGWGFGS
jgi:hypothetical protein